MDIDDEWIAFKHAEPIPGKLVKLRQTIIAEAVWDGHEFIVGEVGRFDPTRIKGRDIKLEWSEIK
jgi:hypothetical protein